MRTVAQALHDFISGLELTEHEQQRAIKQKEEVREHLRSRLVLSQDFISGSYGRNTAIRPLNDIDLFIVLEPKANAELFARGPTACLKAVRSALSQAYPNKELPILQNRSVHIEFTGTGIGYDVVPAFPADDGDGYRIPDRDIDQWIRTDPKKHQSFSTEANDRANKKLKPLIKALKRWNQEHHKPVRSFHLEVMCCRVLTRPPDTYLDGLCILFDGLVTAIDHPCPEPAEVGPNLDAGMSSGERQHARDLLRSAARQIHDAAAHARDGRTAQAHHVLRGLFGADYPEKG